MLLSHNFGWVDSLTGDTFLRTYTATDGGIAGPL